MPEIKTLKLMPYNLDHVCGSAKIKFHLLNKSFDTTFTFTKNSRICA